LVDFLKKSPLAGADLELVTRNSKDFECLNIPLLNPFSDAEHP